MELKTILVTQARLGSTRLPGKVLKEVEGKSLLQIHLERLSKCKKISEIIVATTCKEEDTIIYDNATKWGFKASRGSELDVLDRFYQAVKDHNADWVVRVTSDCPLIDPVLVDEVITFVQENNKDYGSNGLIEHFPDGQDVEVFKFSALKIAWKNTMLSSEREHVTPYIRNNADNKGDNLFNSINYPCDHDFSNIRMTVDEPKDFELIKILIEDLGIEKSWLAYTNYIIENDLDKINGQIIRNEGFLKSLKQDKFMGKGQELYIKAKTLIPGGTMLLSKRPEMFLPDYWPSYFSKSKGCKVWDLDGNELLDMSIMGIGTNTLGYGNEEVDVAVMETVKKGNMSTLNCPEEVYLAEKLIEMNPWADMVRFARTGGEANSIAIRIARAASGKDNVAICGYHGWHDWYLSANHNGGDDLSGHLIPGLSPKGVPRNLKNTVFPFHYNDFNELMNIVENNNIGVIKMEVMRNFGPEDNFLQKVRDLASRKNIVLIFDECSSGFRETFGGIFQKFGVEPDMVMFGKTIGNGYALTAVVGKKSVMEAAQNTFISSTFWTERIGPTAALATLKVMEREKSWETITKTGSTMQKGWLNLAALHQLDITVYGLPAMTTYGFNSPNAAAYKTFVTQEMLKKGILASTHFYACTAHEPRHIERYFNTLDGIYATLHKCESGEMKIEGLLQGPVCHGGFKRLN